MTEMPDGLPPLVREVLAVFDDDLRDVRFGELDAARLAEVAVRVGSAQVAVDDAQDRLDAARRLYEEELAALTALSTRALAYAQIYAESDPALAERLAPLATPESPPRKRRRRKKDSAASEASELPFEAPAAAKVA